MAFSQFLVDAISQYLSDKKVLFETKKMMGGLVFMVSGKMCVCVDKDKSSGDDRLMVRVGKELYDELLKKKGCRKMDFTGKEMKGFLFVYPEGYDTTESFSFWLDKALDFNKTLVK